MLKICSKCKRELENIFFCKDKSKKDGLFIWCNDCRKQHTIETKEKRRLYWENNKHRFSKKIYYQRNKEKSKERSKKWFLDNAEKASQTRKKYRELNLDKLKLRNKEWTLSESGKESHKISCEKYRVKNKILINERRRLYKKNKLATDPIFKFKEYFSNLFRYSMTRNKLSKNNKSTFEFLGYSLDELKNHIEKQFESWMTWENQGAYDHVVWNDDDPSTWKWQLDHIQPQSTFTFSSIQDEDFKKCWTLENLRPLSAKQNYLDGVTRKRHK